MTRLKHIWSVVCQKGLIDSGSNILSLMEVVEKLDVNPKAGIKFDSKNPLVLPFNFEIISFWRKIDSPKNQKDQASVFIYGPDGKELASTPIKTDIPQDKNKNLRTIVKVQGLSITGEGEYNIQIRHKIKDEFLIVAEIPFDVSIVNNNPSK